MDNNTKTEPAAARQYRNAAIDAILNLPTNHLHLLLVDLAQELKRRAA